VAQISSDRNLTTCKLSYWDDTGSERHFSLPAQNRFKVGFWYERAENPPLKEIVRPERNRDREWIGDVITNEVDIDIEKAISP